MDVSQHILENETEVCHLDCVTAFKALSKSEKLYSHYLGKASFYGGLIVLHQTSPESPKIFCLLMKIFSKQSAEAIAEIAVERCGFSAEDVTAFNVYIAGFLANMGNYKGFGDTKFIPGVPREKFMKLVMCTDAYRQEPELIESLMQACAERTYSLDENNKQLGLKGNGITAYFSLNCDKADAEMIQKFLDAKSISAYNTRLFKKELNDGKYKYEVRLASVSKTDDSGDKLPYLGDHEFEGHSITVQRGDYSVLMKKVVENLEKAKANALNENEASMIKEYIRSFTSGDLEAHKEGSRFWIRDQGPIVESYIGFIESYRDPFGTRGEFEGFVAVVNKEMSKKFANLVASSDTLLKHLPWPKDYEKDTFLRPDFTSLDVLAFAGSGIPAGINIPNYDDIRQSEGFKNVSLGNVLSAAYSVGKKVWFLSDEDQAMFKDYKSKSFEVQVGLHELLGHGSGKLFSTKEDGTMNFDKEKVINPLTNKLVEKWYKSGETWDSKFVELSSPYEECRAECVGLYLCLNRDALKIFGHEGQSADDIIYVNWLNMVWAGVQGLLYYTPENKTWRQAHMQARYVILRVLMEAGIVTVMHTSCKDDGKPDALITLDRSLIETKGQKAIGDFLCKLQVYKSHGDCETARVMWQKYATVESEIQPDMLKLRQTVILRRQPRKLFVQDNTINKSEEINLVSYPATHSGLIDSFADRFRDDDICELLKNC
uniref:dipeptidyl peptidase 3-like n=1 Tax=Styela clava TaxID=7725 RepID=UPI00193A267D|nr:dipeptidyl peptidase 3-like [Styela clava]